MVTILAGCAQKDASSVETQDVASTSQESPTTPSSLPTNDTTMCPNAIKDHLAKADLKGKWTKVIKKGDRITVHYVGRLDEKNVFDTSVESVAKACGKYMSGRNYNEGLTFDVGAGQMIPGFDQGVVGMKTEQTKTITIKAKDAYGEWSQKNVITVDRAQLPAGDIQKGAKLSTPYGQTLTVIDVQGTGVVLDGNHELAGKDLIFDITIQEIK